MSLREKLEARNKNNSSENFIAKERNVVLSGENNHTMVFSLKTAP